MNGKTQPAPSGRPTFTDADEKVNATEADPITLMQVVLWLQLLVAAACVCAWVRSKWGWTQVWLVATPVLLAALWGLSNAAVRMLPNLM
jgi:sortase A